ncbi:MAG: gephyrin-like molybdotransferase Glp [Sphingobium sp.]
MTLLAVAEAQGRLLALGSALPVEQVPLSDATGRWLAHDVTATRDQPSADLSAMDGYAIRLVDLPGPWHIVDTSAAGGPMPGAVNPREAVRIFTGAPLPPGADTVIMQEDVAVDGDTLTLTDTPPVATGRHVRRKGDDFTQGQIVLKAGTRLSAQHIALAALAGHATLPVCRGPRIALLSTGSELVRPGDQVPPGKLPASNGIMLRAMLAALPCDVTDMGIVPDDLEAMTAKLAQARTFDIVMTSGGASVGDHDLVKHALAAAGGQVDFWKIRMRPGKPLICGTLGEAIFLGLPGNPVSAFVTAMLFLLPLVRHLAGCKAPLPEYICAALGADLPATASRDDYMRGHVQQGMVTPLRRQDSAGTLALAQANCLIFRAAESDAAACGERITILPFV